MRQGSTSDGATVSRAGDADVLGGLVGFCRSAVDLGSITRGGPLNPGPASETTRPCGNGTLHWSYGTDNTVDIPVDTDSIASNYQNTALLALDSWQSYSGSPFEFHYSSYATLTMFSANGGNNGTGGISTASCTSSGLFTSGAIGLNTYYGDHHTDGRRQSTWAHEIGHSLGLKHFGALNCTDLPVMSDNGDIRYDTCGKKTPQADDRNGISAIY